MCHPAGMKVLKSLQGFSDEECHLLLHQLIVADQMIQQTSVLQSGEANMMRNKLIGVQRPKFFRLTTPGPALDRWATRTRPAAPPAAGSGRGGGCRPREPPAPSFASSYSQILLQPAQKTRTRFNSLQLQTDQVLWMEDATFLP